MLRARTVAADLHLRKTEQTHLDRCEKTRERDQGPDNEYNLLHSSFDRSMILLQDVVQILDRSMAAAVAQGCV